MKPSDRKGVGIGAGRSQRSNWFRLKSEPIVYHQENGSENTGGLISFSFHPLCKL